MNGLSKLQKILLWAGVALIVAALIGAPRYWEYCEMRALKAEFDRFVDVENWEHGTKVCFKRSENVLDTADAARVKAAIRKLEFDGEHTDERYIKTLYEGGNDFSHICLLVEQRMNLWIADIYYVADYCVVDGFVVKNTDELIQVLAELQVKYPR